MVQAGEILPEKWLTSFLVDERGKADYKRGSHPFHDLEEQVGKKLFGRSQSGMRLTEAGRTFLKEARSILAQSQRAVPLAQAASHCRLQVNS